ncbi:MAG: NUDIX hydrolase [Sphingomonadaceae bacterium]
MGHHPPRSSAVLLLLLDKGGETHVVLTKRTHDVANHKGQISLPGGAWEPNDSSLLETALRETREELGIDREQIEVLGRLPDVYTAASNFNITPFVARLKAQPRYHPDPAEVAEVLEVPLSAFRNPEKAWEEERTEPDGKRKVYFFQYGKHVIWGATARILKHYMDQD